MLKPEKLHLTLQIKKEAKELGATDEKINGLIAAST
jgi:hypothetical protein